MSKRLIFFGNERLSSSTQTSKTPLLKMLIEEGYFISAVVVSNKQSTSRSTRPLEIAKVAEENNIKVIYAEDMSKLQEELAEFEAQAGILAAFGRIIPQSLIDLFPSGIINVHPSRLPKYRGSSPIEQTILDGADSTAVSLMALSAKMDAGPVYAQANVKLPASASKAEMTDLITKAGADLMKQHLSAILNGTLQPTQQNHLLASYTPKLSKEVGHIDWSKPSIEIKREIQAYLDWPGSYSDTIYDGKLIITAVQEIDAAGDAGQVFTTEDNRLAVYCGAHALVLETVKPSGKSEMSGQDFYNGYLKI